MKNLIFILSLSFLMAFPAFGAPSQTIVNQLAEANLSGYWVNSRDGEDFTIRILPTGYFERFAVFADLERNSGKCPFTAGGFISKIEKNGDEVKITVAKTGNVISAGVNVDDCVEDRALLSKDYETSYTFKIKGENQVKIGRLPGVFNRVVEEPATGDEAASAI